MKGAYGAVIKKATRTQLGVAILETTFEVKNISREALATIPEVTIKEESPNGWSVAGPRYRAFKEIAEAVAREGGNFVSIQDNNRIMLTVVASTSTPCVTQHSDLVFAMPILSQQNLSRFALLIPVPELAQSIRTLAACNVPVEHIYDY